MLNVSHLWGFVIMVSSGDHFIFLWDRLQLNSLELHAAQKVAGVCLC